MKRHLPTALSVAALVVAVLGWTPVAETAMRTILPANSVGTPQLKPEAVTAPKVRPGAIRGRHVRLGTLEAAHFKAGELTAAPGSMPADGSVTGATVKDATLRLADLAIVLGPRELDPGPIEPGRCASIGATFLAVQPGDVAVPLPPANLPDLLTVVPGVQQAGNRYRFLICNYGSISAIDPPNGAWIYSVVRR